MNGREDDRLNEAAASGGENRAGELRKNIQRLLEARVGPGKAVVEIAYSWLDPRVKLE